MCIFERRLAKNSKQYFRSGFIAWKATKRSASEENFIQFAQLVTEKLQLKNAKKRSLKSQVSKIERPHPHFNFNISKNIWN